MLKSAFFSTLIVAIFSLSFLCTNSVGPVSGVETGNPSVTACARTALSLLNDNSAWRPETYLVSGKNQLDPGTILPTQPSVSLAKRSSSADTGSSTSSEKSIILQRVDTIINVSKVFVNDTITKTVSESDTSTRSDKVTTGTDSTTIIAEKLITTRIVVIDTIIVYDTFTITHYDTVKTTETTEVPMNRNTTGGTKITVTQPEASVNAVTRDTDVYLDIVSSTKSYSVPANYSSNISEIYSKISRTGSIGLMTLSEEYIDADGDGNLLSGAIGTIPIADLRASYRLRNEQQSLVVQFDAGPDRAFSQINDNRINSMHRIKKVDDQISDEITFTKVQSFSDIDSGLLTITRSNPSDSIASSTIRYSIIGSDKQAASGLHTLASIQYTAQISKRAYSSVTIRITPDSLNGTAVAISKANLYIFIDYGKGSGGVFEGILDYTTNQIHGTYSENGTQYDFLYDTNSNESFFQKE